MAELVAVDASFRDKGLRVVGVRLTWKVRSPMYELGLLGHTDTELALSRACRAPTAIFTPHRPSWVDTSDASSGTCLDDARLQLLEREAFNYARVLDMTIAHQTVTWWHGRRVARFLSARMLGTWWTRSLGVVQK